MSGVLDSNSSLLRKSASGAEARETALQLDQSARGGKDELARVCCSPSPNHLLSPLYKPARALAPAMSFSPRETVASPGGCGKESCPFCEMSRQHAAGCARRLPKRIILVRHGESQGNLDMSAYSTTPDYRIPLTPRGVEQARAAGRGILDVVSSGGPDANWKVYFYVSPYERTRATLRGIGAAFPRDRVIGAREECRVREQDFGNFQVEERMRAIKETRERFGRFFFRFPEGESAADVFDRVARFPGVAVEGHRQREAGSQHHLRDQPGDRLARPHLARLHDEVVQVDRGAVRAPQQLRELRVQGDAARARRRVQPPHAPHQGGARGVGPLAGDDHRPAVARLRQPPQLVRGVLLLHRHLLRQLDGSARGGGGGRRPPGRRRWQDQVPGVTNPLPFPLVA
ncbi:unnamed protein product [Triticum turgidum subsp. durum]|uniref:Uncharacterized protein n=1 Tax=Triticum turgidum subsp. durum TaxID=4567 RepID=A0A9R0Q2B7_TRITD|nr:unnamed protein product [Triticum turgidum subsp. durum]